MGDDFILPDAVCRESNRMKMGEIDRGSRKYVNFIICMLQWGFDYTSMVEILDCLNIVDGWGNYEIVFRETTYERIIFK